MIRTLLASAVLLFGILGAAPAMAQISISRSPVTSPVIGKVVRGSTATTFAVSSGGVVTRTAGNAIRLTTASITPPTVTISCAVFNFSCGLYDIRVTVNATGASGEGSITRFRMGTLTRGAYSTFAPADGASLTFDLRPVGSGGSASFTLGMDVLLAAGANSGTDTFTYTVTATFR